MNLQTGFSWCRRCGRTLTDPESVAKGIGPECEQVETMEIKERYQAIADEYVDREIDNDFLQ